ncbi:MULTISPECIES: hypothetical protein [unclassified Luteococcus]|uniref:hypothetical protein n=1 Tax=unclassified Luteococcus TaxID=2639923 RepID=UPI00313C11B6
MSEDQFPQANRRALLGVGGAAATLAALSLASPAAAAPAGGVGALDATASPYNCDPKGVTDCTTARDQLLADAKSTGKAIYWPSGVYAMSAFPNIDFNLRMFGDGIQTPSNNRPHWGGNLLSSSYAHRSFGSRLLITNPHPSTPDQKIGINVIDTTKANPPGNFDGPIISGLGIFGPHPYNSTDWSALEPWVGLALGTVSTSDKSSIGHPLRPRLTDVTVATFGIGMAGSCSVGNFAQLHIVACCTGLQGTASFNGNTFTGINIETCRDYAIRLVQGHSNSFWGGVTQNNVDMTRKTAEAAFGGIPAATRTTGAAISLDDSCVGNIFSGIYMEDGYDNQDGTTQLRQIVLGPNISVYGNHFIECRFGSNAAKNPVVLMQRGNNNYISAYQGAYSTKVYTEGVNVLRGVFPTLAGNGLAYSHVENYYQGGQGWYIIEPTPQRRRYVNASYSPYTCRLTDQIVYTRTVASTAGNAITLVDSASVIPTWSVVIYNESTDGTSKTVQTADGTRINSATSWKIPANSSIEFLWNGTQWLTM